MAKKLIITGEITLPDDEFDAADIMSKARTVVREAEAAMTEVVGHDFKFTTSKGRRERVKPATPRVRKPAGGHQAS